MHWRVAAAALLALTAGCASLGGPATPRDSVTPAPVPTVESTPTPVPELAPGVGVDGTIDETRLARSHRAAIRNRSYAWRERLRSAAVDGNDAITVRSRLRVETERRYWYRSRTSLSYWPHLEFADGQHTYRQRYAAGGVQYDRLALETATDRFAALATDPIAQYLALSGANVSRTTVAGDPYVRVEAPPGTVRGLGPVRNYSVTALVSPDGLVASLEISFVRVTDDGRRRVRYRMAYADLGETTVERPPWVDRATDPER